jgi:hypothetical protein
MRIVYLSILLLTLAHLGSADIFGYSGSVVTYTVTTTGVYNIIAAGAQGGSGGAGIIGGPGGLGAVVGGDVFLTAGTVLDIVVGKHSRASLLYRLLLWWRWRRQFCL